MIDGFHDSTSGWLSEAHRRDTSVQTLRSLTFNALGRTHTCHKSAAYLRAWGIEYQPMDDDEVLEIREEEAALIGQLEQLMDEFIKKYDELELRLHDFVQQYWQPRMDRVLYPEHYWGEDPEEVTEENPDPEYQARVRELGIFLR
ncbi:hypothetical protein BJY04DRAFT_179558 [Aspergillus karnatakaensis]|uniref:uncharacterized protein n=1 Tax=Aspergillus karnatakaensis TaxID=1810916 RepID=UPI003CCD67CB